MAKKVDCFISGVCFLSFQLFLDFFCMINYRWLAVFIVISSTMVNCTCMSARPIPLFVLAVHLYVVYMIVLIAASIATGSALFNKTSAKVDDMQVQGGVLRSRTR